MTDNIDQDDNDILNITYLTEEQWENLEAIMDKPMSERPALQKLLNSKSPWEQSQEVVQQKQHRSKSLK